MEMVYKLSRMRLLTTISTRVFVSKQEVTRMFTFISTEEQGNLTLVIMIFPFLSPELWVQECYLT